jgi:hypothetical protein
VMNAGHPSLDLYLLGQFFVGARLKPPADPRGSCARSPHLLDKPRVAVGIAEGEKRAVVGALGMRSRSICDALAGIAPGRFDPDEDGAWRVEFELWPIGHRFSAGHRIRLQVSSGAHPRYARNPGTGADPVTATTLRPVDVELLHGARHPSALILPANRDYAGDGRPRLLLMGLIRALGQANTVGSGRAGARAYEEERRAARRSDSLGPATLACRRCDAPVAVGPSPLSLSDQLTCPFCDHRASVRDFLSLALPTRPAQVVIRVSLPASPPSPSSAYR